MIKRRFYKMEHGDRDDPSNQSSSSSDSEIEVEPEATEDSEYDDDDVIEDHKEDAEPCSTSSGLFMFFLPDYSKYYQFALFFFLLIFPLNRSLSFSRI